MLRTALKEPGLVGVKVVLILQDAPLATLVPQVFVWVNTLAFVPVMETPVIVSAVLPVLVSATSSAFEAATLTVPKSRLAGTSFTLSTGIVMAAAADLVVSFKEIAVRLTVGFVGIDAGAV